MSRLSRLRRLTPDRMLDPMVGLLHSALESPAGDRYTAVRVTREALRAINDLFGQPICSADERARRREERQHAPPFGAGLFRRNPAESGRAV